MAKRKTQVAAPVNEVAEEASCRVSHALLVMAQNGYDPIMDCYGAIDKLNNGKGTESDIEKIKSGVLEFFADDKCKTLLKKEEGSTVEDVVYDIDLLKGLVAA